MDLFLSAAWWTQRFRAVLGGNARGYGAAIKELRLPAGLFVRAWFAPCAETPLEEPIIPYKSLSSFRRNKQPLPALKAERSFVSAQLSKQLGELQE